MLSKLSAIAVFVSLILTGAIAGFFYAWSVAAMPGLDHVEAGHAIPAMQSINVVVRNPVFFLSFFGMPIATLISCGLLLLLGQKRAGLLMGLAAMVYIGGAFLPTMLVNVPLNEALAQESIPGSPMAAQQLWLDYSRPWTLWNTLRAAFSFVSLLIVGLGIYVWGRQSAGAK